MKAKEALELTDAGMASPTNERVEVCYKISCSFLFYYQKYKVP